MSRLIAAKTSYFPAGEYYIGDPCYVVADKDWGGLLDENDYFNDNDGDFEYNGGKCWTHSTAWGDGTFEDDYGREYGVDAGLIGIMPLSSCDADRLDECGRSGGQIVSFDEKIRVYYDDGVFHFGDLEIDTN